MTVLTKNWQELLHGALSPHHPYIFKLVCRALLSHLRTNCCSFFPKCEVTQWTLQLSNCPTKQASRPLKDEPGLYVTAYSKHALLTEVKN